MNCINQKCLKLMIPFGGNRPERVKMKYKIQRKKPTLMEIKLISKHRRPVEWA